MLQTGIYIHTITHHISHITYHTSHITYHTSHITYHTYHTVCDSSGAPTVNNGKKRTIKSQSPSNEQQKAEISEFLDDLRELGIGDPLSPITTADDGPCSIPAQTESEESTLSPVQQKLASEWVPLELSFGVPLFNQRANRAVCDKVTIEIMIILIRYHPIYKALLMPL